MVGFAVIGIVLAVPSVLGDRDEYSYQQGRDHSEIAVTFKRAGIGPGYRDACEEAIGFYESAPYATQRIDHEDFIDGCLDAIQGG